MDEALIVQVDQALHGAIAETGDLPLVGQREFEQIRDRSTTAKVHQNPHAILDSAAAKVLHNVGIFELAQDLDLRLDVLLFVAHLEGLDGHHKVSLLVNALVHTAVGSLTQFAVQLKRLAGIVIVSVSG
jgi:hypothetical protein